MQTIKGPITFKKGQNPPKKMQDWIDKNGIKLPFDPDGMTYSNRKLDDWFVVRWDNKKYKYNKKDNKMEKETGIVAGITDKVLGGLGVR